MDDQSIIRRVQDGDVDAYAHLVRKYHGNLLRFIVRLVQDHLLAEDIGQEVFLAVYRKLPRFEPDQGTPFAAWLYIVARNRCISELRKLRRTDPLDEDRLFQPGNQTETMENALIRQEEMAALAVGLQEIAEPFRTTILMSLKGASLAEIAGHSGVSPATVKTRLFRAREKLKILIRVSFGGVAHEKSL